MRFRRVKLFRLLGFDIRMDASWIFLIFLLVYTFSEFLFPVYYQGHADATYYLMAAGATFGIIVSIIVHELAHAILARRYNVPVSSVTLFLFGGVAEMSRPPDKARHEFLMVVAGPLMSAGFGLLCQAGQIGLDAATGGPTPVSQTLDYVAILNYVIAAFNVVPAFPLDGGRALRAALWGWQGDIVKATKWAARLGSVFAFALIAWGLWRFSTHRFISAIWLVMIGYFVLSAGSKALQDTRLRSLLAGIGVGMFARRRDETLSADRRLTGLTHDYFLTHLQSSYPVVKKKKLTGVVRIDDLLEIPADDWDTKTVGDIMRPLPEELIIDEHMDAVDALDHMYDNVASNVLVTDDKGNYIGALYTQDMYDYIALAAKIEESGIAK